MTNPTEHPTYAHSPGVPPHDEHEPKAPTRRWRLDLAYNGAAFSGWAAQPGLRTVQGVLEQWITRLARLNQPAHLVVAGRTDAGVHARAQVAHVDLPADIESLDLLARLHQVLPDDLVVHTITAAPEGFDARFAATKRHYCYRIWDASCQPDPLRATNVLRSPAHLDPDLMTQAGQSLLGLRDFAAFCKAREGATTIRTLMECRTQRLDDGCGTLATTVVADAFCHSMVRSLVGALVDVGAHRRDLAWLASVAAGTRRAGSVTVLPAHGLTLEKVSYPPDAELAARVDQARARRSLTSYPAQAASTSQSQPKTREDR